MSLSIIERLLLQRSGVILPRSIVVQNVPSRRCYSSESDSFRTDSRTSRNDPEDGSDRDSMSFDNDTRRNRIERPVANEPLPDDDPPSPYVSSPRIYRGVHRRDQRHKGQTPAERAAIDKSLADIFAQLDPEGPDTFNLGPSSIFGSFPNRNQQQQTPSSNLRGDATSLRPWSRYARRGIDREENDDMVEALDELKEEVSAISTDLELLDWARRRVFDTLPKPITADSTVLSSEVDTPASFPSTYPRILAHLMKVSRQHFNNPHLSLSFFHQAQTHSPESYLSGCLSSAYTELIRTRWECFRDLEGVYRAIQEMDANAVSWDRTTQSTIGKIVEQVGRDLIQSGQGNRWGEGANEILLHLEKKVQKSLRTSEILQNQAKRDRERRLWS